MKIIIIGKSASGKDYLKNMLKEKGGRLDISWTTRKRRDHETDGVDMIFTDKEHFMDMVNSGNMLQYQEFNNNLYGTSECSWNTQNVFIMNVNGLKQLSEANRKKALVVYINPPPEIRFDRMVKRDHDISVTDLESKWRAGDDDAVIIADTINNRIEADEHEYADFSDYDIEIIDPNYININMV
jgi:guanylate kinase